MLDELMHRLGIFKLFENEILVYMNTCSTQLKFKKCQADVTLTEL